MTENIWEQNFGQLVYQLDPDTNKQENVCCI